MFSTTNNCTLFQLTQDDDDELHVLVTAETQASLEKAVELVRRLLVPVPDALNEHKHVQLEELARLNGNREESWLEQGYAWNPRHVQCSGCGGLGHIAADCLLTGRDQRTRRLEFEFEAFLSEIGEAPEPSERPAPAPPAVQYVDDASYAEFRKVLGNI